MYWVGIPVGHLLSDTKVGKARILRHDTAWRQDLDFIRIVVAAGHVIRPPDLDDPLERRVTFGMAKKVCYRADRREVLRKTRVRGLDEMYELEDLLDRFHHREPLYVGTGVAKIVMALGPNWRATDPKGPPRFKLSVRHRWRLRMSAHVVSMV
jgi:hypothetical protein